MKTQRQKLKDKIHNLECSLRIYQAELENLKVKLAVWYSSEFGDRMFIRHEEFVYYGIDRKGYVNQQETNMERMAVIYTELTLIEGQS